MGRKRETLADRIAAIEPSNDCVLWEGSTNWQGHPMVYYRGRTQTGQRVSYQIHNGAIPPKHWVIRTCRNLLCVNPKHLILHKAGYPIPKSPSRQYLEPPLFDLVAEGSEDGSASFTFIDPAAYALMDYPKESV